jgi:hypothetical protein
MIASERFFLLFIAAACHHGFMSFVGHAWFILLSLKFAFLMLVEVCLKWFDISDM